MDSVWKRASFELVLAPVADLRPNPRNPRTIRPARLEQLKRTMAAEPGMLYARPVIALKDGTVIAGNQRLEPAQQLEWETIPTVFVELDEVQAAYWTFLDNRGFGEDDEDLAAELLAELRERGGDLALTGFERSETDAMLRRLARRHKNPDAVLLLPEGTPDSNVGVVYRLGAHRLMCGDATNPGHVATLLNGEAPLLLATDPPYGVALDNSWRDRAGLGGAGGLALRASLAHRTTRIEADSRVDWSEAFALVPSLCVAYVWHASRHACEVQAGLEQLGFDVRQQLIWDKGGFALSRQPYHWAHEPCLYAVRRSAKVPWLGGRKQSTVWQAPSPKMVSAPAGGADDRPVDHPTQKPVLLFSRPIENHLQPGEAVYDPFAGSGTAVIAAEVTGRRCYAMELDPRCCDLIRERFGVFSDER